MLLHSEELVILLHPMFLLIFQRNLKYKHFSVCGLYVVGSSLNGFGSNSSDMDLCLMITDKEVSRSYKKLLESY